MKALKIIGGILIFLVLVLIILNFIAPKEYQVERSLIIDAPKEIVFKHIKYWRAWHSWSPWAERDKVMQVNIKGIDGEPGSVYEWTGDPDITGKGEMINTGIKENQEITYRLHFIEPIESQSDGYLRLLSDGKQVKALWGFKGHYGFPVNIMMLFMNMDKAVGADFERGLENLKKICEEEAKNILQYEVHKSVLPAQKYAVIKGEVDFKDVSSFLAQSYGKIMKALKRKGYRVKEPACGLYYTWDEKNQKTEMAAGFPVSRTIKSGEMGTIEIPPGIAYYVEYYGPYEKSANAHYALDLYLQQHKLTRKPPVIEQYISGPSQEKDSSKWLTKIYYYAE
jgi:effector-binding domain-containing protein